MLDFDHLRSWIGATETRSETIAPFPANALSATLDRKDPPFVDGSALPPLWHWLHFLPIHALAESGPDGHAARGGFLPPVPLPRRMWAGSRLTFLKPLRVGARIDRISSVTKVDGKDGRSGPLVFVTVRHVMSDTTGPAIEEEHDIVYRAMPQSGSTLPEAPPAPAHPEWDHPVNPDAVLLFRYSALTFNSHRIHYDRSYVTEVEGYPGLIVHGPLIATLLLDGLARVHPAKTVRDFSFRAVSPIFDITPFSVCGRLSEDGSAASLWARHQSGALAMQASATFS